MGEQELADCIAAAVADRKALDIAVIDVRGRCSFADFLVVASGTSERHVQSIAAAAAKEAASRQVAILGQEGLSRGEWALVDFGSVVLHVFHHFTRGEVDMDGLWQRRGAGRSAAIDASAQAL